MGVTRDMEHGRGTIISVQAIAIITEEKVAARVVTMQGRTTRPKATGTDPMPDFRTAIGKARDADIPLTDRLIVPGIIATAAHIPGRIITDR